MTGLKLVLWGLLAAVALTHSQIADQPSASAATPTTDSAPARVSKLLVFVIENHSLDQMRRDMPKTFKLAQQYGYATNYRAIAHPSLPNYLSIAGGSTFGVTDDADPAAHPITGPSVFGQAIRSGRTATIYSEGMRGRCALQSGGQRYAVKHNPWAAPAPQAA